MRLKKYNFFYKLFFIACFFTTTFFTQNAWGQTAQSLKYSANPGKTNLTNANGWTENGIGTADYADAAVKLKFDDGGDYCILKIADPPGKLTYKLKNNSLSGSYNYEIYESPNGSSWSLVRSITSGISTASGGSLWTDSLNASTRYIKWVYTTKATGNIGMGTITILPATPTTTSISPSSKNAGDAGFTLTVNGTNFISGKSTVKWGGSDRTTSFVSSTELTASISASDISSAGTASVTVTTTDAESASNAQTFTINASGSTPPSLTAAGSATVNAAFDVTFTDDATWRGAITGITIGGTTLTAGYSVSSGKITFTPSASNPSGLLQTSGTKSIVVKATGYTDATVSQTIGFGAANKLGITTQPVGHATINNTTLATQPVVVVQDQYGNTVTSSSANITASVGAGTWSIGGTTTVAASLGIVTFTNLTANNTSGADITNPTISFASSGLIGVTSNTFSIKILYAEPSTNPTTSAVRNAGSPTSSIDVSWTSVTADGYLVVRRLAGAPNNPTDGTTYNVGDAYSNSTVVYIGTGTSFTDGSLTDDAEYRYNVYAFNGSGTGTYNYKTSSVSTGSAKTLKIAPATQASFTSITAVTSTGFTINFGSGSGSGRMVLVKQGSAVDAAPVGGTVYTASLTFGSGDQLGTGNYVVYYSSGDSVAVKGLTPNTTYHVAIFEYNGIPDTRNYNTTIGAGNIGNRTTLVTAPSAASAVTLTAKTPTSISLSWTNGGGAGRIVVARQTSTTNVAATGGTDYTVSSNSFTDVGNGTTGTGNIVVYKGTGKSVTITDLSPATSYGFYVYEYNGSGSSINYASATNLLSQYTLSTEPTAHAASFTATANSATKIDLAFSAASTLPANGYLILRKSSAFVAGDYPTDGTAPIQGSLVGSNGAVVNSIITSNAATTSSYTANADETWYFLLVPFNWDGTNGATRNYYTGGTIPEANATTTSGASDVVAVASSSPASISSLINDAAPLTSSTGVQVWQITIRDGGSGMNDADALPTKVSAITFTAGSGNSVSSWSSSVKTAALFDGATLLATATISGNSFVFSGLSISVADNSSKTLSLRISLNEILGASDDGKDFQFQLSNTNITSVNDGTSSGITNFSAITTVNNTENVIAVVATKLVYSQQPSNVVVASTNISPAVKVKATDINGNIDLGFTSSVSITATGSVLTGSPVSATATAGEATFSSLQLSVPASNVTLIAAATGLNSATSDNFNVTLTVETLALWTFETSVPATAGPHTAEGGINGGNATNPHSSGGVTYSNFVGNGSAESFSSDKWSAGDYYQFTTSTSGYEDIFLTIHQTSSNSGPKNFKVQYSTDGSSFTDLSGGSYSIANDSWSSSGSPKAESIYSFDLSSISSLDNKASIYIRLTQVGTTSVDGGTVATGGTNRVDNVTITGYPMTYTWTGSGGDNKWTTTSNWDCNCGKTPSSNHVVVIPNGSNVILDANYTAKLLTLQATSTLKIAPLKTLTVAGIVNLNNQSVTIQSDATGTGSIGKITGSLNDATNVTVERYISASGNRAYRLLAPSVNTSTSIKANWMEGVNNTDVSTNSSPNAGYGTHITGAGGATNGFDPTQNNQASLFNLIGNAWVAASNTSGTLDAKTGYLLFVRGNRDNINTINTTTGSSNTTLRATGTLLTGTQTFSSLPASSFSLVTNPYVSAIDWGSIYTANSSNFENFVTIWDPNIGTRGGYVSIQNDGTKSVASVLTKSIQSGQAFFVKTKTGGTKTLTITENNKDSGNNNLDAYRSGNIAEQLSIMLQFTANSKNILADGVVAKFANNYQNIVDENDATQIANFDEDISLMREEKKLSIESRGSISTADTLFIGTQNLKVAQANYRWVIAPENFATIKLQAHLQDNYTNTSKPISLSDTTIIAFSVNNDDASKAIDRFRIVFSERQTYYSKANNLSANDLNSWSATKDGTGISPASFDNNALFVIQQGHVLNLNSSLNLSQSNLQIEQNAGINNTGNLYIGNDIENNGSITGTGITEINGTTKQTISGVGKISNIKLNNTLGANIDVESKVFVLDSYIPTAGILTTNGNLVLVSNETTTASITTGAASGNYLRGNVMVERFIPAKATRKWSFVASPVTQSIAQSWQQQIHITGAGNGGSVCPELAPHNNGFDATVTNTPSMYSYDASQTSGQRWIALNNTLTENLTAGKAFRVNIRGDRNLGCSLLDGTINTVSAVTLQATGLINIENHNAGNFNISYPNTLADNYVFVGNPYPSAINFNTFRTDNSANIANNYAIYIPTNNAGVYTYWDANTQTFTGGTGYDDITGNEIVSGQAFFVQAKNIGNVTLTFTEEQKVNTHNTGYFKPKNYPEQIKINYLQNNVKVDEAIIRFVDDENISNTSFNNLDIPSMNSGTYISSLKSTKGMVVQTRNLTTLKQDEVWLNIGATASGTYQLNFSDFDNFANTDIYLTDHYTNTTQNIRENAVYEFSIDKDNAATKGVARFSISFNRTIQPEYVSNVIKLYPNPANKQVTIELPQTADNTITYQIKVTDIAGKIVMEQKQLSGTHQLSLDKLTTGTYLIEITDSKGIKTTEKLVKQ